MAGSRAGSRLNTKQNEHPKVFIDTSQSSNRETPTSKYFDHARSQDKSWEHSLPVTPEWKALLSLKHAWECQPREILQYEDYKTDKEIFNVDLDDFEIYASPEGKHFAGELTSLAMLHAQGRELYLDGILSIGSTRCYIQAVPIKVYSIEGYGEDEDATIAIYIQSRIASGDAGYDIWYRFRKPSHHYAKIYRIFHWVATLGKHTIDFLEAHRQDILIGLEDFRERFYSWLLRRFPKNTDLKSWLEDFDGTDFRKSVNANIEYLAREMHNLSSTEELMKHTLWADCMKDDYYRVQPQPIVCKKTIATPHTYQCFKNRYFASQIVETQPTDQVRQYQEERKQLLGFPTDASTTVSAPADGLPRRPQTSVYKAGDVVSILPTEVEARLWRKQPKEGLPDDAWLAYVHRVEATGNDDQRLFVFWLYRPADTTISSTDYPVKQELFFSDHCNCKEPALYSVDIGRVQTVEWLCKGFTSSKDFLIRQKYVTGDNSFMSLRHDDFRCRCGESTSSPVSTQHVGDTVYITKMLAGEQILEPAVIHCLDKNQKDVTLRRLVRLKRDCSEIARYPRKSNIADNELAWTRELFHVPLQRIKRGCHVRFFSDDDIESNGVPFPYNRGGAGDYWILSGQLSVLDNNPYVGSLSESPSGLNQGPDIVGDQPTAKFTGLSLFSGCGNLDKGLEAGGCVEFTTAVDMCAEAIHTLRANKRLPEKLKLWFGSVDDYLQAVLMGKEVELIARIGEIAVIAAGSPCPGFSTLQQNWQSEKSLRNASHVTTFCSFVDIYRPKYGFLENVVNMACLRRGFEEELVLSQIVACLVAMGYQVRQFIMGAWNYGSPQRRSRLIISIAAPGLTPLTPPIHTHSHPDEFRSRSIGELMNGQRFGRQEEYPTPFPFVTAGQAMDHLPDIGNGRLACIQQPDHRPMRQMNMRDLGIMARIPTKPPGQGLAQAVRLDLIPIEMYSHRKEIGKAYQRIQRDGLIPTIVTTPSPHDARNGASVHWTQPRPITIEEARLTQGIPSEEVIIGPPAEQMKIVGNAVDRRVSEALGLELRRVYATSTRQASHAPAVKNRIMSLDPPSKATVMTDAASMYSHDDDEHVIYDSDSGESMIDVNASRKTSSHPPPKRCAAHEVSLNIVQTVERDRGDFCTSAEFECDTPPSVAQPTEASHTFEGNSSTTLARGLDLLRPAFSATLSLLSRNKRTHEESDDEERSGESSKNSSPSKRARSAQGSEVHESVASVNARTSAALTNGTLQFEQFFKPVSRRIRPSGLQIEFEPRAWNKIRETELKEEKAEEPGR